MSKIKRSNRSVYLSEDEWEHCKQQDITNSPSRYIVSLIQMDIRRKKQDIIPLPLETKEPQPAKKLHGQAALDALNNLV